MSQEYIYFRLAPEGLLNVPILVCDLLVQQDRTLFIVAKEIIVRPALGSIFTDKSGVSDSCLPLVRH